METSSRPWTSAVKEMNMKLTVAFDKRDAAFER
jgi:hypothetical protein